MKRALLVLLISSSSILSLSQTQFENPGFEAWESVAAPEEEPTEYSSLKTADALAGLAPQVIWQTATANSGSFACSLVVAPFNILVGLAPNSTLTNGRVHAEFTAANGYVFTDTVNSQWQTPCTDRPDSLVGWFQYTPQGSDIGKVEVLLHDNSAFGRMPHDGSFTHWVGKARYDVTTATTAWTRFSVPFSYYNNNSPDYVLMVATSGDSLVAVDGSMMLLDDIELIYNPLLVNVNPPAQQTINISTNGAVLTVTETTNAGVTTPITREWKWSTTSSGPYASFGPIETGTTYTPNFATAGVYYVVCETDYGLQGVITSNEVEIIVVDPGVNAVTITPGAVQNLNETQNGNLLTANETPSSASSREWMWTTTSGSGYQSFSPTETTGTYTPNFAAAGTYYVICESDFSGDIQTSNEVTIIVAPAGAGIEESEIKFNIYHDGSLVQVFFESLNGDAVIQLFSLDGKQLYQSKLSQGNSQHNVDASRGIYIYRVVNGNKIITGKINL
jgi:hypothetical protein